MAEKVTIRSSRLSEREYDEIKITRSDGRGVSSSELIGYQDAQTGLIVGDVTAFESWINGLEPGRNGWAEWSAKAANSVHIVCDCQQCRDE